MSDRIFALVWLAVCALILVQMSILVVPFAYEPVGPKAFPAILAVLMAICCLSLLSKPDSDIHWPAAPLLAKGVLLLVFLLAYARFFEILGFPLATAIMVFLLSLLFGARWWSGLITAAVLGLGGYLLFDRVLEVSLPPGWLGGLI